MSPERPLTGKVRPALFLDHTSQPGPFQVCSKDQLEGHLVPERSSGSPKHSPFRATLKGREMLACTSLGRALEELAWRAHEAEGDNFAGPQVALPGDFGQLSFGTQ